MDNVINVDFTAKKPKVTFTEPLRGKKWSIAEAEEMLQGIHEETRVILIGDQAIGLLRLVKEHKRALDWIDAAIPRLREAKDLLGQIIGNLPQVQSLEPAQLQRTEASLLARRMAIESLIEAAGTL